MSAQILPEGTRVVVTIVGGPVVPGRQGVVTAVDGDDRAVRFERPDGGTRTWWLDTWFLASAEPCREVTVYGGEAWCDTHDSAMPCPVGALIREAGE